ncbi:MAG: SRPBCC family protein [Candidatus Bathyarchaeota archaeon]|nr:SRPBCC family protein [Candidatus Bathyarchaeota archaeon]
MTKIEKSVIINAPVEKVYDLAIDVDYFAKAQPPETETKNITKPEKPPKVGRTWKMRMKTGDQVYEWKNEITELEENKKIVGRQKGGPFKKLEWTQSFESSNGGTKYTIVTEYDLPLSFLGKIIDKIKIEKEMDKNFDHYIKKTKELIEKG